jgi:hypothetical protein
MRVPVCAATAQVVAELLVWMSRDQLLWQLLPWSCCHSSCKRTVLKEGM